jgi:hypothetical protein
MSFFLEAEEIHKHKIQYLNSRYAVGIQTKLHSKQLHNVYHSTNNIRMKKSGGRMKWARYVARMREPRDVYRILVGNNCKEEENLEDVYVDRRIILKWTLKKYCVRKRTRFSRLRIWPSGGLL